MKMRFSYLPSSLPEIKMSSSYFGLAASVAGCLVLTTTFAAAGVSVRGTSEAAHVETQSASVDEVLRVLSNKFSVSYVSNIVLSEEVNGTYDGPLSRVIALLLPGRSFVLEHDEKGLRLVIIPSAGPASLFWPLRRSCNLRLRRARQDPAIACRSFPPPPPQTSRASVRSNRM